MLNIEDINKIALEKFSIHSLKNIQVEIIQNTLKNKHSLIIMPTGMGKSICYQLPSLYFKGLTIVISPLIALMEDQVQGLQKNSIDAIYINSKIIETERKKIYQKLSQGSYKILYITPERFHKQKFIHSISKREISLLAIDEAHCISQWGNDFRMSYSRISEFRKILNEPTTMALTATATKSVQNDIIKSLHLNMKTFHAGVERKNLYLEVKKVFSTLDKFKQIKDEIYSTQGNTIIYFTLIQSLKEFSHYLDCTNFPYQIYHGKLSNKKKVRNAGSF